MDSNDLTRDQAAQIGARIREAMVFVGSLRERMDRRGWNPNDRLYQEAAKAYDALHGLNVSLHYIGCGMIPWRAPLATGRYIVAKA